MRRYSNRGDLLRSYEAIQNRMRSVAPRLPDVHYVPHRVRQRLDPGTIGQLVMDYEAGVPTTQLMLDYGLSKDTVLRLLREAGVAMRRQGLDDDQTAEAMRLYRSGLSLARVGEQVGFGPTSVANALRAAGVRLRARHDWRV